MGEDTIALRGVAALWAGSEVVEIGIGDGGTGYEAVLAGIAIGCGITEGDNGIEAVDMGNEVVVIGINIELSAITPDVGKDAEP